jgi:hypothetical protein
MWWKLCSGVVVSLFLVCQAWAVDWLPGRYESVVLGDGERVLILDTQEGHCWDYDLQDETLRYRGQLRPGSKPGEAIAAQDEKSLEELREEVSELQRTIERKEKDLKKKEMAVESRRQLQKAIEKEKMEIEIKKDLRAQIEGMKVDEELKERLLDLIDRLQ